MDAKELLQLAKTGKPRLMIVALQAWEKTCPADPEPLMIALRTGSVEVIRMALPLALRYHPGPCRALILDLLSHPDPVLRGLGVEQLGPELGPAASRALQAMLERESEARVLASAVLAAGRLRLPSDLLASFLKHKDPRVRANAAWGLVLAGGSVRQWLEPLLHDPSLRVQNEAIKGLAGQIKAADLEALIMRRLASPRVDVRAATAYLTGELSIPRRVPLLIEALQDPEIGVVRCAARALARTGDPLGSRAIVDGYLQAPEAGRSAAFLAGVLNLPPGRVVEVADRSWAPATAPVPVAERLLALVGRFSQWEPFLPWILGCLDRSERSLRLEALRLIRDRIAFFQSHLDELTKGRVASPDPEERALTAQILWRGGQTRGFELLRDMLYQPAPATRAAAAAVLRTESNLLARHALREAAQAGILEAAESGQEAAPPGGEPISLPSAEPPSPSSDKAGAPVSPIMADSRRAKKSGHQRS